MPGVTLLSDIRITLHTRIAAGLWQAQSTSLPLCLALLNRLLRAERHDDPWAAHWLTNVRLRLDVLNYLLQQKQTLLDRRFAGLPEAINTPLGHNPAPMQFTLPLALLTPPGSRLMQIVAGYDRLVCRALLAWRLDLISQEEKSDVLSIFPRLIRQLYSYVNRFRTTGVTRDDVRHNTPLAQGVARRLGQLPKRLLADIQRDAE